MFFHNRASGSSERLRRLPEPAHEGAAHALGIRETCRGGDLLDGLGFRFHPQSRRFRPQSFDRPGRCLPGFSTKGAAELARADAGGGGESLDRKRLRKMVAREGQRAADAVRFRFQFQQGGKLRLSSGAAMVHDQLAGHRARHVDAQILLDQGERQVKPTLVAI